MEQPGDAYDRFLALVRARHTWFRTFEYVLDPFI
jgi:hypothetical protein